MHWWLWCPLLPQYVHNFHKGQLLVWWVTSGSKHLVQRICEGAIGYGTGVAAGCRGASLDMLAIGAVEVAQRIISLRASSWRYGLGKYIWGRDPSEAKPPITSWMGVPPVARSFMSWLFHCRTRRWAQQIISNATGKLSKLSWRDSPMKQRRNTTRWQKGGLRTSHPLGSSGGMYAPINCTQEGTDSANKG
jgi:hypothetical protein